MSLQHAILVLLDREPASGYDLAQRFNRGIGHFWMASHQQIYQQLKKMTEARLVRFAVQRQHGKPDRKLYRISAEGRKALAAWMGEVGKPPVVRDALLIKIFAAKPADYPALLEEIQRHIDLHRTTLAEHRTQETLYFEQDAAHRKKLRLPYLTLRRGIRYEREWIEWLEETRQLIEGDRLPEKPA